MLAAVEREDRGEQLRAEALRGQLRCQRVRGGDEILEVGVADDDPVEAELVGLALDLRAALLRDGVDQLVDVVERAAELARGLRLERDRGRAGGFSPSSVCSVTAAVVSAKSRSSAARQLLAAGGCLTPISCGSLD